MKARPKAEWLSALEAAKVPCGPINNLAEVFADPQVQARGMAVPVAHPLTDALKLVASPIKMSVTPPTVRRAPPLLGEHTREVMQEYEHHLDKRLPNSPACVQKDGVWVIALGDDAPRLTTNNVKGILED
jgi:crotonobetainyl-CoA:carnitine CoA-transferase CaiB-like acyl-CoA transferase